MSTDLKLSTIALAARGKQPRSTDTDASTQSSRLFAAAGAVIIASVKNLKSVLFPGQQPFPQTVVPTLGEAGDGGAAVRDTAVLQQIAADGNDNPPPADEDAAPQPDLLKHTAVLASPYPSPLPAMINYGSPKIGDAADMSIAPQAGNDNSAIDPAIVIGLICQASAGGGGGGGSSIKTGSSEFAAADADEPDEWLANRAPVVSSQLRRDDKFVNYVIIIALADLLARATDADGNPLAVTGRVAAAGELTDNGDQTWTYVPASADESDMTFNFPVSDRQDAVAATAIADLIPDSQLVVLGTELNVTLVGGPRPEIIDAGRGNEIFLFVDFDDASAEPDQFDEPSGVSVGERIDLSLIDADYGWDGQQHFAFRGEDTSWTHVGQPRYHSEFRNDGGHAFVFGNSNDDFEAEFTIERNGRYNLTVDDFFGVA